MDGDRSLRASLFYAVGAGLSLAYFIAGWGAAYYVIGLASLFVFVLVLLKRYNPRMLINYSIIFGIALMIGTKVPYLGTRLPDFRCSPSSGCSFPRTNSGRAPTK